MLYVAAYFALFLTVGAAFVFANLLVGSFVRPHDPHREKREVYECGEPTIGSSYVQFDLRFYVVALLFIVFGVEVAFFFPWAIVAGKANILRDPGLSIAAASADAPGGVRLTNEGAGLLRELGVRELDADAIAAGLPAGAATLPADERAAALESRVRGAADTLAWIAAGDIALFFAVLLVGFAYVWKRGDLDWVRASSEQALSRQRDDKERRIGRTFGVRRADGAVEPHAIASSAVAIAPVDR